MSQELMPAKALIFRITHVSNIPWMVRNGLHCATGQRDLDFVPIGNTEVITKRTERAIPGQPLSVAACKVRGSMLTSS